MKTSNRVKEVPPYLFVELSRKIAKKKSKGVEVVSFGIGDPDIPTPDNVVSALRDSALDPSSHRYPETDGLPEFRQAAANWYQKRFGVNLDPDNEVLPLIGAKEGIGHAALSFIDPGDIALIPDPGYPVYSVGTLFAGGTSYPVPLLEQNEWLPDLDRIPIDVAENASIMWINYPNNPTAATADVGFFQKMVAFAKKHNIAIMHDGCYSEVAYDDYSPPSFLQAAGAIDVGLEFHSLSKTYNMTGWRLGMVVGNAEMIEKLMVVKSNLDSGVPQAIQMMGIEAMSQPIDSVKERNEIYQNRRDRIVSALSGIGLEVESPKASLYIWAKVPVGYTSTSFAELLLEERDLVVTAGNGYGEYGEGYVRFSMTISESDLQKGLDRLSNWTVPEMS